MTYRHALAAAAILLGIGIVGSASAADTASLAVTAEVQKECNFVSGPTALLITGATGSLTSGMKATGEFTYSCNYDNGPLKVAISSTVGQLVPDGIASANGGTPIPYGICVRGSSPGAVRCDQISGYAPITMGNTDYQTVSVPGFGAPNALITATATYGFELQNPTPATAAGSYSDVVSITLVP